MQLNDITTGIRNIFSWFRVIWNDRQWDYSFFLTILEFKLQKMEKFFREDACYVGSEEDAKSMKTALEAIQRLIADEYDYNCLKSLSEKWGSFELGKMKKFGPDKVKTEEDRALYSAELKECVENSASEKGKDLGIAFDIIRDNVVKWWD